MEDFAFGFIVGILDYYLGFFLRKQKKEESLDFNKIKLSLGKSRFFLNRII